MFPALPVVLAVLMGLSVTVVIYLLNRLIDTPMVLKVKLFDPDAKIPAQANDCAAGYDLFCFEDTYLYGHATKKLRTGIGVEIPPGYFGMVRPRGSAMVRGLAIQGTIDSDYRGEIFVVAHNTTDAPVIIEAGKAMAQMILTPYLTLKTEVAVELSNTTRGNKGFGSTGNT